jgi:Tol biopolymer transport system component/DNA-binding winged helix-turn-helix (wHTH) protein
MSLLVSSLYEFGDYRLDTKERILMRGDQPVELTPKGFELLSVLVENHGRLLKKDELMDKIWADSFVEESNLTFNIRQLRKILGDDAHDPKYIKTVRQHGYRFIGEVKQISKEDLLGLEPTVPAETVAPAEPPILPVATPDASQASEISSAAQRSASPKTKRSLVPIFVASVILFVGALGIGSWYARSKSSEPTAPVLAVSFSAEKLSTNGKVTHAVLSPDGRNVVYTNGTNSDKESVWLRQLEDGSNVEIIPPSDDIYFGLELSPDGSWLYFARLPRLMNVTRDIYRVSIFGGIPQKIINDTESLMSISPDGKQISFVRCPRRDGEFCSLWIADAADGKNERKLISRPHPFRIADHRFSPDGKTIAFAVGQSATASNEFGLAEVDLASGAERELTKEKFFDIDNLVWLPDRSGWLLTASRVPNRNFFIWQISAATGEAAPLTKNSESYSILRTDKDATKVVSTQIKHDFHLRLLPLDNPSVSRTLADATSVSFAPDGKIYFASLMSGNDEIWSINSDGSSQRQLTNNAADESVPIVSPNNNSVFFLSNRTGAAHVWRMNPDGSNQTQITRKEGGEPIFVSPDGEWIYYHPSLNHKLWRVSTRSGEEQLVLDKVKFCFAISPDGLQVAFSEKQGEERVLAIASLADGQTLKTFRLANPNALLPTIVWLPDGKSLGYVSTSHGYEDNALWLQTLDGKPPRQIADIADGETTPNFGLAVSPDGKSFALAQGRWLHDAVLIKGLR